MMNKKGFLSKLSSVGGAIARWFGGVVLSSPDTPRVPAYRWHLWRDDDDILSPVEIPVRGGEGCQAREMVEEKALRHLNRLYKRAGGCALPAPLLFGGVTHPGSVAPMHFVFVGKPGSGKSTLIDMLCCEVLPEVLDPTMRHRALVFDAKHHYEAMLCALGFEKDKHYYKLDPSVMDGCWWNIADDITDPTEAMAVAESLLADSARAASSDAFWNQATIILVSVVVATLTRLKPGTWTLRDVVNAFATERGLRDVLGLTEGGRATVEFICRNENKTWDSILVCSKVHLGDLPVIAALFAAAQRDGRQGMSVRRFRSENAVLILGHDPAQKTVMESVARFFLNRLYVQIQSDYADVSHDGTNRTWVIFDEMKEAGSQKVIPDLMSIGRSKGVCCILSFQDMPGIKEKFGGNIAESMVDLAGCYAVLHSGPETAAFGEKLFGTYEVEMLQGGGKGDSYSVQLSRQTRSVVLASEIAALPKAGPDGVSGYFKSSEYGCYFSHIGAAEIELHVPRMRIEAVRRQMPSRESLLRPLKDKNLSGWTDEERGALGLPPGVENAETKTLSSRTTEPENTQDPTPNSEKRDAALRLTAQEAQKFYNSLHFP